MTAARGFRAWFGPSRQEIWRQFAAAVGGEVISEGFWRRGKVVARHGPWTVTLDTYTVSTGKTTVTFTRMRAPYVNPEGFRFNIHRAGVFTALGEWLGFADVKVGDPAFDQAFVVKGTDEGRLRQLLGNPKLRELLSALPKVRFMVKDDEGWFRGPEFPAEVDELHFQVPGIICDLAQLENVYHLLAETLDELCRMGSAYAGDPNVNLG